MDSMTERDRKVLELAMIDPPRWRGGFSANRESENDLIARELVELGLLEMAGNPAAERAYYSITDAGAALIWSPMETELAQAKVDDRVRFAGERRAYTIQARGERYLVCTKPFALRNAVIYTVVDLRHRVRGTEDLAFGLGAGTREECEDMLARLEGRDPHIGFTTEVSHRNRVNLEVTAVLRATRPTEGGRE